MDTPPSGSLLLLLSVRLPEGESFYHVSHENVFYLATCCPAVGSNDVANGGDLMTYDEKLRLLPALRGGPAVCLLSLLVAQRPLALKALMAMTGLSKPSVRNGLALLESLQLAVKQTNGWTLSAVGFALLTSSDQATETLAEKFFTPTTTTDLVSLSEGEQQQKQINQDKISILLKRAGVGVNSGKMQSLLAADMDALYVEQHVLAREAALARGEEYSTGLFIKRLEDGDPAPAPSVCRCGRCEACLTRLSDKYPGIRR